jgi:ribonucleotide reductase beta subunit family protein with ferritin-like domain
MSVFAPQEVLFRKYPEMHKLWDDHERAHWIIHDADLRADVSQWRTGKITEREKAFIKMILRLFTQADTDVAASYIDRLLPLFKSLDAREMLLSFANREFTHMNGYKLLNDTLGYDSEEFMTEFLSFQEMRAKHEFLMEDADLSTPAGVALYLVKQIHAEGTSLFGSFAMLLAFSQHGKLPGMVSINKWSIPEESMHASGLAMLFREVVSEHPEIITDDFKLKAYDIARQVVVMEDAFIDLCFSVGGETVVDQASVKRYVRRVADYRMTQMGFKGQFDIAEDPLPWISYIVGNTFVNFFEATSVEYSKASMIGEFVYPKFSTEAREHLRPKPKRRAPTVAPAVQ